MGALQSIRENLPDVEEENSSDKLTPVRPTNKRLLSVDPRSPSETIERTPIVVEKTPMPGSSKVAVQQFTPVSGDRIDDPRSPTADFTRTPINPCLAAGGSLSQLKLIFCWHFTFAIAFFNFRENI